MTIVTIIPLFVWALYTSHNPIYAQRVPGSHAVVEKPMLLNSYLPAAMQIISHLTDLMKYDVKPATPSTTTPKPTSPHRPAIFAPPTPPSVPKELNADRYFYRNRLTIGGSHDGVQSRANDDEREYVIGKFPEDLDLLGALPNELLNKINIIEDYDFIDDDQQVHRFLEHYDDFDVKQYIIGNKKTPPPRAYVTLLSLYDQMNAEAKKLKLNKYGGYTPTVLKFLESISTGTAAHQLHSVLTKMLENKDTDNHIVLDRVNTVLKDLNTPNSYINQALRYVPPLRFEA